MATDGKDVVVVVVVAVAVHVMAATIVKLIHFMDSIACSLSAIEPLQELPSDFSHVLTGPSRGGCHLCFSSSPSCAHAADMAFDTVAKSDFFTSRFSSKNAGDRSARKNWYIRGLSFFPESL